MAATTLAVVGPTCTGKSALALALARRFGGELVNADALQVYRGLERGTAKPDAAARAEVPHHLLDLLDPREPFSAGEFARRARVAIADIASRGRLPIVVGGSGLYLRALWRGLAPVPPVPDEIRAALCRRLETEGSAALYDELRRRDAELASRLTPADRQRVMRGLEVLEATGRSLSSWQRETAASGQLPMVVLGLTLPRSVLYDRIATRAYCDAQRRVAGRDPTAAPRRSARERTSVPGHRVSPATTSSKGLVYARAGDGPDHHSNPTVRQAAGDLVQEGEGGRLVPRPRPRTPRARRGRVLASAGSGSGEVTTVSSASKIFGAAVGASIGGL